MLYIYAKMWYNIVEKTIRSIFLMSDIMNTEEEKRMDWKKVRLLLTVGIAAAVAALAGDMLLSWGKANLGAVGLEMIFSRYLGVSAGRTFISALIGMIAIPVEWICATGIYRIIAESEPKQAGIYRVGIGGMTVLGGIVHIGCCAAVYVYNAVYQIEKETAFWEAMKYGVYFLLPAAALYLVAFVAASAIQIRTFAKSMTSYPRWCCIFCPALGFLLFMAFGLLNVPLFNALGAGWISLGNIWAFGGLLAMSKKAERGDF